jgi:two-component system, OmpR family, phosphate regulon sensor histidine kinase PhoR
LNLTNQLFVDSANHRAIKTLTRHVPWYVNNKNRNAFLDSMSHLVSLINSRDRQRLTTLLDSAFGIPPVRFTMQYSSIVLAIDGIKDTLLKKSEPPFVILGEPVYKDQLNVGDGIQTNNFTGKDLGTGEQYHTYMLTVSYSKKADISGWKQQVGQRMAGTFLLAVVLILGMVILFYVMFRTLLHQKKIADIQTDLTNNITHELRTPLSSLSIIIKSLRKTFVREQPAMYDELMISLERQQSKLSHIVDRVLESAWATDVPLRMKQHEMNSLVRQIATNFPMETHSLMMDIPNGAVLIGTDEYVLTSIIYNMLDNAVKYSNTGTQVEVKTYVKKDQYLIAIKDHGKGIAVSEQSKIFGKFYRVTESNLHSVKGIGLGLYLCQVNTKRLNGSLSVESEPMKGSTFIMRLPLT